MSLTSQQVEQLLPFVKKPGRYCGGELGAVAPDTAAALRFCLIFPDLYEIGMSHQGLQILYHIINRQPGLQAERCYAPDRDMENELRTRGLPLFSLESRSNLADFDVLGITLPYELCYTNILTILDLSGIALRAENRGEQVPLVLGGGSCALNPEPVADFFDAIVLGDGEEVVLEIAGILRRAKGDGLNRMQRLELLATIPGVYVPQFFAPLYNGDRFAGIRPLREGYQRVRRRVVAELPAIDLLNHPIVPFVKLVHDRLGIEIARGCTRGCRFCQAGIIYRPVRERPMADILALAEQGIANSGFEELALLSLSTGDFSCLPELMGELMDRFADRFVSVSMPSMRVGTLTPEIMEQIRRVRKTGFTVAPEAGTDRLREVINKGITEEDLLSTCRDAFALGWNLIKFYFMIGLPTETMEDVDAIIELARLARQQAGGRHKAQINVSVGTFVPKPHTPFQRAGQLSMEESRERINYLKKRLPSKGFQLKWHAPEMSFLEGVFSRGDRRLALLIETAWQQGARFDGWSEEFDLERWQRAAVVCDMALEPYLRQRSLDEPLPWNHLESGVDADFLQQEEQRALEREYTKDCREHGCQQCGLCDFKEIRPRVNPPRPQPPPRPAPVPNEKNGQQPEKGGKYRVTYRRIGRPRFLGHLEILQLVFRALQRAEFPVLYSRGFNPSPRVSFSPALPVGMESEAEYFDMELARPLDSLAEARAKLNRQLPQGLEVTDIDWTPAATSRGQRATYRIIPPCPPSPEGQARLDQFFTADQWLVERSRKGKRSELDIRPLVAGCTWDGTALDLVLIACHGQPASNPREFLIRILGYSEKEALLCHICKTGAQELNA